MNRIKKYTKTSTFIFPFLNIPKSLFLYDVKTFNKIETKSRFINSYIYSEINEDHNLHVSIVCNSYQDVNYDNFYQNITSLPNFVDCYEVNGVCIFIMEIPDNRLEDLSKIINGKYSEVSPEGKLLIIKHHYFDSASNVIPMILNKSDKLKKAWENQLGSSLHNYEVWGILNKPDETLTFDKLHVLSTVKKMVTLNEFE